MTMPRRSAGYSSAATTMLVAHSPIKKTRATICSKPNSTALGAHADKKVNSA